MIRVLLLSLLPRARPLGFALDRSLAPTSGCLGDCSEHGVCLEGVCHCEPSWRGEACAVGGREMAQP